MKKTIFLTLFLAYQTNILLAEHSGTTRVKTADAAEDVTPIIDQLESVVCDPQELRRYLQDIALEDESRATEKLDHSLRELYKFDKQPLTEADRLKMMDSAINGTRLIQANFKARWEAIRSRLRTDPNEFMKALDPALEDHIVAVYKKYSENIETLELQKADPKRSNFTGISCAACSVGYPKLSAGLKKNGLDRSSKRDKKNCPKGTSFDGSEATFKRKTYTVGIYQDGKVQLKEKGTENGRDLQLPSELPLLKAIDKYYHDNAGKFENATPEQKNQINALHAYVAKLEASDPSKQLDQLLTELKGKNTQKEKFETTLNKLSELESSVGVGALKDWMEQLKDETKKKALIEAFGIPAKALIKSDIANNRWSKGYTVDYSQFDGGPARNSGSANTLRQLVLEKLHGPSGDANHVLLNLTGACFYCDAALWPQVRFP